MCSDRRWPQRPARRGRGCVTLTDCLGPQPPLLLAVLGRYGRCVELPSAWHLDCLGCQGAGRKKTKQQLREARLLHWNGPNKPWSTRAYRELFRHYWGAGARCNPNTSG